MPIKRRFGQGFEKVSPPMQALMTVIELLEKNGTLPRQYKPHKLSGNYKGHWECHIKSNWLLVQQQNDKELVLLFTNTGTHSDLFR